MNLATTAIETERLDYVELIRQAVNDRALRRKAFEIFRQTVNEGILLHDEGMHPRISDVGRCSLELATDMCGMHDLDRTIDAQLFMLDQGTLSGAWNAALLSAALPHRVALEYSVLVGPPDAYVPGHIDALVFYDEGEAEPVEFKLTQAGGQLRSPKDASKLYQIGQTGLYSDGIELRGIHAPTFCIVTSGPNVGKNKDGVPYPKMRQDRYVTADFRNEIDGELARLQSFRGVDVPGTPLPAPDAKEAWRCESCCFSGCARNRNPLRLIL